MKSHVSCNLCKNVTSQFYSDNLWKLSISFFTYLRHTEIWKLVYKSDLNNCKNWSSFQVLSLNSILISGHYLKNAKYHVHWKVLHVAIQFLDVLHLQCHSYLKSLILNSCTLSIFPALKIMELAFVGKILWHFDIIFHIWLIHLFFH